MLIGALFSAGYTRIQVDVDPRNARARHVYEAPGVQLLAVRENCRRDQLGLTRSAAVYALTVAAFLPSPGEGPEALSRPGR